MASCQLLVPLILSQYCISNCSCIVGYDFALSLWYCLASYSACNSATLAKINSLAIGGVPFSQVIVLISSPLTDTSAVGLIFMNLCRQLLIQKHLKNLQYQKLLLKHLLIELQILLHHQVPAKQNLLG
jgi:hypothetical protein